MSWSYYFFIFCCCRYKRACQEVNRSMNQDAVLIHRSDIHLLISRFSQAAALRTSDHLLKLSEALDDKMGWMSVAPYFEFLLHFWPLYFYSLNLPFPVCVF